MSDDNAALIADGVTTTAQSNPSPGETKAEQTKDNTVPLENRMAELTRKFSKINELSSKVDRLVQYIEQQPQRQPEQTQMSDDDTPEYKRYVDARFQEQTKQSVKQAQESSWAKALEMFPELDKNSDKFDEAFLQAADKEYGALNISSDPNAPMKAVRLAAVETGRAEKLARDKLLQDEARRSRIIGEGGTQNRESNRTREPQIDSSKLSKLGLNADKIRARIKSDPERYGS